MLIKQVHQKNVIFVTIGVLKILVLSMNRIFAKVVYIYKDSKSTQGPIHWYKHRNTYQNILWA